MNKFQQEMDRGMSSSESDAGRMPNVRNTGLNQAAPKAPAVPAHPGSTKHKSNPNIHSKPGGPIVGGVNGANMA